MIKSADNTIFISEQFTIPQVGELFSLLNQQPNKLPNLDFSGVSSTDSAGLAAILQLKNKKHKIVLAGEISAKVAKFEEESSFKAEAVVTHTLFEEFVISFHDFFHKSAEFVVLAADTFYYTAKGVTSANGRRRNSVFEQINLMGNKAVPIVLLLSMLIGLILSLQSAAQLRQFGANIFLVDLIVVSMVTEMGPMITAIIVAGRSGSAVAAEIATMKITEELDALKVMALNPLRYVVAPKMIAMTISLPLLTIAANLIGIFGGFIIAVLYLDLNPEVFWQRAFSVMDIAMWRNSIVKSVIFSWLIVLIGAYFGFNVKGGADGVGKATTSAVVASIFSVIMADALLSLVFYFDF